MRKLFRILASRWRCLAYRRRNLKWAAQNDILTLDPHSQNHATTNSILQHTYEGLTRYTKDYRRRALPRDGLEAALRHALALQPEARASSSTTAAPFTADDVVFSFGRIQQKQGTMQIYVTGVEGGREGRRPHRRLHPAPARCRSCCATSSTSAS